MRRVKEPSGAKEGVWVLGEKQPQVPSLRFAPVGMTILLLGQVFLAEALTGTSELSSRPERSGVEGPAVAFPRVLTHPLKPDVFSTNLRPD
jgi:hypothetical protein